MRWIIAAILAAGPAFADGDVAGEFDYYVMALSWSPNWCALEGDARGSDQCDTRHDHSFTLHGLWPQHERGWPAHCRTPERDPSRADTAAMADIMGTGGLAWYQWKKHGRCSGLSSDAYFALSRKAYQAIEIPQVFQQLDLDIALPAQVVEEAFLDANPGMSGDMITITCKQGRIQEARICLTKDLELRSCSASVARDCTLTDALMDAVR